MAPAEINQQELNRYIDMVKHTTPEGLFNYYQSLNRQERRRIDQRAAKMKAKNEKIRREVERRRKEKVEQEIERQSSF